MNDNQEKKQTIDENTDIPIAKRIAKFSAFIYLALAITVVIVATVGIFSISYDYEESMPQISFPEIGITNDSSKPQQNISKEDEDINTSAPTTSKPDNPVVNEESNVDATVSEEEMPVLFYRPVNGEISKGYSMDALVFSQTMKDYRVHSGIDISAQLGERVVCFADGIIDSINDDYFYGMTVSVTHSDGSISCYMNLDKELAANIIVGNQIKAGQPIGTVGNTAKCENKDEPHLHFEMRVDGKLIDPTNEIPQ